MSKSWDRLSDETDKAYEAFKTYLEMPDRSLQKVYKKLTKSRQMISRWAKKYEWKSRAASYDSAVLEAERKQKILIKKKELERQRKLGSLMVEKAIAGIEVMDVRKVTPYALVQLAEVGSKIVNQAAELSAADDETSKVTQITIVRAGADSESD